MDSLALASRIAVRPAVRRALAWLNAAECIDSEALWAASVCPCIHWLVKPDDAEVPPPTPPRRPPSGGVKPTLAEAVTAVLPPPATWLKAELKVELVDESERALCSAACVSVKNSLSVT